MPRILDLTLLDGESLEDLLDDRPYDLFRVPPGVLLDEPQFRTWLALRDQPGKADGYARAIDKLFSGSS